MRRPLAFLWIAAMLGAWTAAHAQEARQLNRIATPVAAPKLPPGARAVAQVRPVPAARVEAAVRALAASWNTPALAGKIADNFYAKDRLLDAIQAQVPRDAKLRVLAVEGMQTLSQYTEKNAAGAEELVSRVSVTVRTQVELNDPRAGFRALDGTNEIVLVMREAAP